MSEQLDMFSGVVDPVTAAQRAYNAASEAFEAAKARCGRLCHAPKNCSTCAGPWAACVDAYKALTLAQLRAS